LKELHIHHVVGVVGVLKEDIGLEVGDESLSFEVVSEPVLVAAGDEGIDELNWLGVEVLLFS
jgi:hypothetical protein